jgi:lysylphosphatidylglycerol synthetase-like protein (DUF2156 family)
VTLGLRAPQLVALTTAAALALVLSLDWFGVAPSSPPAAEALEGGGILNLLNTYRLHASGWGGLGWLPIALLALGVAGILAGLRGAAVAVAALALAVLVATLATEDDDVVLRWPAYAGVVLAADLLVCAVWAWRGGEASRTVSSRSGPNP